MAIAVNVKGKHLQVTDGLRQHAEQRLQKLETLFQQHPRMRLSWKASSEDSTALK